MGNTKEKSAPNSSTEPENAMNSENKTDNIGKSVKKKSTAKAAGLKSALYQGNNRILFTTFGRGAEARRWKYFDGEEIESISNDYETSGLIKNTDISAFSNKGAITQFILRNTGTDHNDAEKKLLQDEKKSELRSGEGKEDGKDPNEIGRRDNPLHINSRNADMNDSHADYELLIGMDQIHCKKALEAKFFGDDSIKKGRKENCSIQIIYNILDIEKELARCANNIIFAINNLMRNEGKEFDDFIGENHPAFKNVLDKQLDEMNGENYRNIMNSLISLTETGRIGYFGTELAFNKKKDGKHKKFKSNKKKSGHYEYYEVEDKETKKYLKRIYNVISVISDVRHSLVHGSTDLYEYDKYYGSNNGTQKNNGKSKKQETIDDITELYESRINELNNGFLKNSKKDIYILHQVYGNSIKPEELIRQYYDFVVRKSYKNIGISIKDLREIIAREYAEIKDIKDKNKEKKYNEVRQKLNRAIDFIIYMYYESDEGRQQLLKLRDNLRRSRTEEKKEQIYRTEASRLWKELKNKISKKLIEEMTGEKIAKLNKDKDANTFFRKYMKPEYIADIKIGTEATNFSKIIYIMTLFLDGKEINELLTLLINKFDNISSFLNLMEEENKLFIERKEKELPYNCKFVQNYNVYNFSQKIAGELRIINSFARMTQPAADAKKTQYLEAAELLGCKDIKKLAESLEIKELSGITDKERELLSDEEIAKRELEIFIDALLKVEDNENSKNDQSGKKEDNNKGSKKEYNKKKGYRNFIANNVIESDTFKYLIRYGNPMKLNRLANNKNVIGFVLGKLPEEMIASYYRSCTGISGSRSYEKMKETLLNIILELSLNDFQDVKQSGNDKNKEKKKNIIRLYLTMLYHLQKNLVNINSRYFFAFYREETDTVLFEQARKLDDGESWSEVRKDKSFNSGKKQYEIDRTMLTRWYLKKYRIRLSENDRAKLKRHERIRQDRKEKMTEHIENNLENSDPWAIRTYRNKVMHLAAVRNADSYINDIGTFDSYFELYHYLMQREIESQYEYDKNTKSEKLNEMTLKYFENIRKYKTYSKDFLKALNTPFAYNIARYKNLSIAELFDRNNYGPALKKLRVFSKTGSKKDEKQKTLRKY